LVVGKKDGPGVRVAHDAGSASDPFLYTDCSTTLPDFHIWYTSRTLDPVDHQSDCRRSGKQCGVINGAIRPTIVRANTQLTRA
jgi:hypothetical protein